MRASLVFLCLVLCLPSVLGASGIAKIRMRRTLGGEFTSFNGIINVAWEYLSTDRMRFSVTGKYNGWVGIGFSYSASMSNTDFVVGFVNGTGSFDLQDRFTNPDSNQGHGFPSRDVDLGGSDDLEEATGKLENGTMSFSFVRRVNTGDSFDKIIIKEEMFLLYAYGDVLNGNPRYHGSANRSPVKLSFYPTFEYNSPDGVSKAAWEFTPAFDAVTFEIRSTFNGWLGLGISEAGVMDKSDFVIAWVDSVSGNLSISDRAANPTADLGHGQPSLDVDLGGVDDIVNATGSRQEIEGTMTTIVSFSRKCDTGDKYDVVISNREIYLLYAYGEINANGGLNRHTTRGSVPINFQEGRPLPVSEGVSFVKIHAAMMMLAWSVLVVPATIIARYFKSSVKTWFSYHWMFNTVGLLAASVAFILILIEKAKFIRSAHSIIGTIVIALGLLQGMLGQASNSQWYEGKTPSVWPDKVHWNLGRLLIILAIINIFLGLDLYQVENTAFILYAAYVGITLIYVIFLETRVGQSTEYESINDYDSQKNKKTSVALFFVYWLVAGGLVTITLVLALA